MRRLLRLGHLPALFALCLFLLPWHFLDVIQTGEWRLFKQEHRRSIMYRSTSPSW